MLSENDIREQLSIAYMHAVASRTGYAWEPTSIDRDGIDGRVVTRGYVSPKATLKSPGVGFQLKSTSAILDAPDPIPFALKQKNYDDLRGRFAEPRYLALFILPANPDDWLQLSPDALVLRRCMYWISLTKAVPTMNTATTTVYVPRANILSVTALRGLMESAACEEVAQ